MRRLNNLMVSDKTICKEIHLEFFKDIDLKEIKRIVSLFLKYIFIRVLDGDKVSLPSKLGILTVIGKKKHKNSESFAIDFKNTKKLGKTVYLKNNHSDGFTYSFRWVSKTYNVVNKRYYKFVLAKPNKIKLNKKIMSGKEYKRVIKYEST